ncbi:UNVERIFIED_CONTAM: G-type lectin S-receptor-like serine/threonine-protein kinase [Sesamum latifolium]|uniref:Receptor-like serine/threonine-protein kinase n=1 Tax=Sesamum latifolium TaxID=2727402 RepID=A0AAW2WQD2_9LAMI
MISGATDTINVTKRIIDGETMVSAGGMFELGFFSPGNSRNRYVGMWYKNVTVMTVVWVANREAPLTSRSGVLRVTEPGILVLLNDTNNVIWSSNTSRFVQTPVAQLLDSGNLVVKDANDDRQEKFLWQSFNYPTDTFLPAPGDFTYHLDPTGYPQIVMRQNKVVKFRIGPWNGLRFSGIPNARGDPTYRLTLVMNKNEVSYLEHSVDRSVVTRFTLSQSGVGQRWTWVDRTRGWVVYLNVPTDNCDSYKICGANGIFHIGNSPACGCLDRFEPKDPEGWIRADWSNGCIRRTNMSCQGDAFLRYSGSNHQIHDIPGPMRLDLSKGSGSLIWFDDLVDIRALSADGQDIYIRVASSELGLGLVLCIQRRKKYSKMRKQGKYTGEYHKEPELPLFKLSTILKATNNFSIEKKLGEGGFGPVYKNEIDGIIIELSEEDKVQASWNLLLLPFKEIPLEEGQEIAVKRLSRTSTQGLDEFKNEVIFIAKLQHRNLVRLLGCCIQGEENMLIYEYMPNKSLDVILFDQSRRTPLDWPTRFHIINGIARGLLYLHQDSRLRIIHRDLKASNILLDADMNPKISDFGTARSFGGNETAAKHTDGYMSPEYTVDGLFSVKSDVFSFGVLVLEIVSGKRNRGFSHSEHHLNLLGHAWTLHKEERSLEIDDTSLGDSFDLSEVLRSIHVGLLCVQKKPEDRPSMSTVVLMLGNQGVFPPANQPGFYTERETFIADESTTRKEVTDTLLEGR